MTHEFYEQDIDNLIETAALKAMPAFRSFGWTWFDTHPNVPDEVQMQNTIRRLMEGVLKEDGSRSTGRFCVRSFTDRDEEGNVEGREVSVYLHLGSAFTR